MRLPLLLTLLACTLSCSIASEVSLTGTDWRHKGKTFPLDHAELNIELAGGITTTSWKLRFRNDTNREAEGLLNVPLRSGCHVVGYAMDVNGIMREGMVVDAKRARRAYEEIVRQKIDPGILEQTAQGFKTSVYPLPPHGAKTIRVDLAELRSKSAWQPHIPKNQHQAHWKIICHDPHAPQTSGFKITWRKENGVWIATGKNPLSSLAKLTLTPVNPPPAWAATPERNNIKTVGKLAIHQSQTRNKPKHIHLWWDGSLTARERNTQAVLESLKQLFAWTQNAEVTLTVIRDSASHPTSFKITDGHCQKLLDHLRNEPAESMVRFDLIKSNKNPTADTLHLIISEGKTPLPDALPLFPREADVVLLDPTGNAGHSLGLATLRAGHTVRSPLDKNWQFKHKPTALPEPQKWSYRRHKNHWIVTAELASDSLPNLPGNIVRTSSARAIWARETHRAMRLSDHSAAAQLSFAKRHKVLTAKTAFIVLDRIQDYITYEIEPPEQAMQQQWKQAMLEKSKKQTDHLTTWTNEWLAWHKKFHQTPPDYAQRLTQAMAKTSSFWAKHIGNGNKQVPAAKMTHLVQLQAKAAQLAEEKPSHARLKSLAQIQHQWAEMKKTMAERIGFIHITVGGFVKKPGPQQLPIGATLADALKEAGGATPFGSIKRTELIRQGKRYVYDLRKLRHKDVLLHQHDTISLPQKMAFGNGGGKPGAPAPFDSASEEGWIKAAIKKGEWKPNRPYIKVLSAIIASKNDWKPTYRAQSAVYGWKADYYLDVIELLENNQLSKDALPIAGNIAQLSIDSPELLRRAARAFERLGDPKTALHFYQRISRIAPDEPTSWLDLARWHSTHKEFEKSISYYAKITEHSWQKHWRPTWTSAMIELNGLLHQHGKKLAKGKVSPTRQVPLSADLRIVLDWDAARSNIDLRIQEPLGQTVGWGHPTSVSGGSIPGNAIAGYGPEEYIIHHASPGVYDISTKFHGDWTHEAESTVTITAQIITNFGRPNQTQRQICLRLPEKKLHRLAKVKWEVQE